MTGYRENVRIYQDESGNWVLLRCANDLPIRGVLLPLGMETRIRDDARYLFEDKPLPIRAFALDALSAARWSVGKDPMMDIEWPDGRVIEDVAREGASSYLSTWEAS